MTENLGVLLVDVPEPKFCNYSYIELNDDRNSFCIENVDSVSWVSEFGYKCTEEEAREDFPQFRWVAIEEL